MSGQETGIGVNTVQGRDMLDSSGEEAQSLLISVGGTSEGVMQLHLVDEMSDECAGIAAELAVTKLGGGDVVLDG